MPRCVRLKRKHRKVCVGDLDNTITLQDRAITAPASGFDATEVFTTNTAGVWAKIDTSRGETVFDGSNTEVDVTHVFTIRWLTGITAETWILFDGERFDILDTQDLEERNEWLIMKATNKGTTANAANEA